MIDQRFRLLILACFLHIKEYTKNLGVIIMVKKTIMLACSAGMSTSLLVTKMEKAAEAKGIDVDIFAVSASDVDTNLENKSVDVLLLGPQVRFMKDQFESKLSDKNIPVDVINMSDYGMMNGENVLNQVLSLIGENEG